MRLNRLPLTVTLIAILIQAETGSRLSDISILFAARNGSTFSFREIVCEQPMGGPAPEVIEMKATLPAICRLCNETVPLTTAGRRRQQLPIGSVEALCQLLVRWQRFQVAVILDGSAGFTWLTLQRVLLSRRPSVTAVPYLMDGLSDIDSTVAMLASMHRQVVVACDRSNTIDILNAINRQGILKDTSAFWIFMVKEEPVSDFYKLNVSSKSQLTILRSYIEHQDDDVRRMLIYDVFSSTTSGRTEVLRVGDWCRKAGPRFYKTVDQVDPAGRMRGRTINIITFEDSPYSFIDRTKSPPVITGYLKDILDVLSEYLNFRPKISIVESVFGNVNATTKQFSGLVGRLHRREADMALNVLGMTSSRNAVIRYSTPVVDGYLSIFLKRPLAQSSFDAYFLPFERRLWWTVAGCTLAALALLALVKVVSPSSLDDDDSYYGGATPRLYWFCSGYFIDEIFIKASGAPLKLVFGSFLVAAMLLFDHYTSIFTSFLAYQNIKLPFESMEEVATNRNFRVVLVRDTNHYEMFQQSKAGAYSAIWRRVLNRGLRDTVTDVPEGLDKVQRGGFVFLSDGPSTKYMSRRDCSVVFLSTNYFKEQYFFGMRRDFPYYNLISSTLHKMTESGMLDLFAKRFLKTARCPTRLKNESMAMSQVVTVFLGFAAGAVAALLFLVAELLSGRCRRGQSYFRTPYNDPPEVSRTRIHRQTAYWWSVTRGSSYR